MYIFPNPLTDVDLMGSVSLVTEAENLAKKFRRLVLALSKVKSTPEGQRYPFYIYRLA